MLNYATLEAELATKLNADFTTLSIAENVEAVVEPQTDKEARDLTQFMDGSKVVVKYLASNFGESMGMNQVSCEEEVTVGFMFITTNLRNTNGLYALFNIVKASLIGYRPNNCKKRMIPIDLKPVEHTNLGVVYMMSFKTSTVLVQGFDDSETSVNLFKLLIQNNLPSV
jgi:hypothetical protein